MAITKINSLGVNLSSPLTFSAGTAALPSITFSGDTNTGVFAPAADTIGFAEGGAEAMRIDSSGRVFIGTTLQTISSSQSGEIKSSGATGFAIVNTTAGNNPLSVLNEGTSGTRRLIQFLEGAGGGTVRGFISTDGSTVAYNTTSDYRLKENIVYNFDATTRLKQLKPARFNFKTDSTKTVDGFIAHEVKEIIPEAISGEKDAVDEKGNILPQGIDQSKLTPILTKALQEAIAKIEQLEARLTALESK